jgi:hypothetical protein
MVIMHEISQRIQYIMERESTGIDDFCDKLIDVPTTSISKLFKIDKRTDKYPLPPTELLIKISETFPRYNARWLLTGLGEELLDEEILEEEGCHVREITPEEWAEHWKDKCIALQDKYQKLQEDHALLLNKKIDKITNQNK